MVLANPTHYICARSCLTPPPTWSAMSVSMSMLQVDAMMGWLMATLFSVRTAAKRSTGLEEDRNSCSTATAGTSSRAVTFCVAAGSCATY